MPRLEESPDALHAMALRALAHWGLEGAEVALHLHRENAVFRVSAPRGDVYALRVHQDGYHDLAELQAEHTWTSSLALAGLPVPEAVPTLEGGDYATVAFPGSTATRHVGLVRWIAGVPLSQIVEETRDPAELSSCFEQLGSLVAGFHDASAKWTPPPGFRRHARDAEGLVGEKPFWGRFWEIPSATDDERARLLALRNAVRERFARLDRSPEVYGMIHADLHADNVLVDGERLTVIDFDDAGFGWYAYDLTVALYSELDAFHPKNPHFELAREALLGGYRRRRPLSAEQVELVSWFTLTRALELLSWAEHRPWAGYDKMIPHMLKVALEQAGRLGLR